VFARARDVRLAAELVKLGATDPVPETTEASLTLGGRLLAGLGIPEDAIHRRLEEIRLDEIATVTPKKPRAEEPPTADQ
jgi:monovalent cation:H+ antiporter-2, CPA2 family